MGPPTQDPSGKKHHPRLEEDASIEHFRVGEFNTCPSLVYRWWMSFPRCRLSRKRKHGVDHRNVRYSSLHWLSGMRLTVSATRRLLTDLSYYIAVAIVPLWTTFDVSLTGDFGCCSSLCGCTRTVMDELMGVHKLPSCSLVPRWCEIRTH